MFSGHQFVNICDHFQILSSCGGVCTLLTAWISFKVLEDKTTTLPQMWGNNYPVTHHHIAEWKLQLGRLVYYVVKSVVSLFILSTVVNDY
jgi:hypothetical protein